MGCLEPTLEPLATDHVPDMVRTIRAIIDHGHAYVAEGGGVFFDIQTLPGYGRLSRLVQAHSSPPPPPNNESEVLVLAALRHQDLASRRNPHLRLHG